MGKGAPVFLPRCDGGCINVLFIPDQFRPHLGKRMGIVGAKANGVWHGDGPSSWGEIGTATKGFKMRFWNFRPRVNYYYLPYNGFPDAGGKKRLHEVIVRIFKLTSPLKSKHSGHRREGVGAIRSNMTRR